MNFIREYSKWNIRNICDVNGKLVLWWASQQYQYHLGTCWKLNSYYSRLTEQDILGMWPSSLCFIKVSRRYWCPSLSTADWTNGTCSHIIVKGTQRLLPFLTAVFWLLHLCKANAFLVNHSSEEGRAGPEGCQHCAFCHLTPL